jgi:hypothetical protein
MPGTYEGEAGKRSQQFGTNAGFLTNHGDIDISETSPPTQLKSIWMQKVTFPQQWKLRLLPIRGQNYFGVTCSLQLPGS